MKKTILSLAAIAGALTLTSCGTSNGSSILSNVGSALLQNAVSGSSSGTTSTTNISNTASTLGNLLSDLLGSSSSISQSDIVGTWNYTGTDCVFESDNLLAKAGGSVAASKIEKQIDSQLSKVGIKSGSCSFTFNKDNTYTATIGSRTISGNYTLDTSNKKIKMTYLAGVGSMTPRITKSGNTVSLLFESDKLLSLLKGASALTGSSSLSSITSLLGNYDGLYIGLKLKK